MPYPTEADLEVLKKLGLAAPEVTPTSKTLLASNPLKLGLPPPAWLF